MYALQVPIEWEEVDVTPILKGGKTVIPDAAISSVKSAIGVPESELKRWRRAFDANAQTVVDGQKCV